MLLLTNDEVQKVLSVADCITILRRFFQEQAAGRILSRPRIEVWVPLGEANTFYQFKTMEGAVPFLNKHVIRIDSMVTEERVLDGTSRIEHRPHGETGWMGMLLVFDLSTGTLLGMMPDGYLQRTRVGALYALAAERLARHEADDIGLIGSGWQAGAQLIGLSCIRKIRRIRCYSPNPANRRRFAAEMSETLGIGVMATDEPHATVVEADIVALATNAGQKVIEAAWAEPGQHVSAVSVHELDPELYMKADRVVVNRQEPWIHHYKIGELQPREAKATTSLPTPPATHCIEARELFGSQYSRNTPTEVTVFPNEASNFQLGGQFAAVASYVYEKAHSQGLGRILPSEWFSQKLHP